MYCQKVYLEFFQHSYFYFQLEEVFLTKVMNLKGTQHTFSFELVFRLKEDLCKRHNIPLHCTFIPKL